MNVGDTLASDLTELRATEEDTAVPRLGSSRVLSVVCPGAVPILLLAADVAFLQPEGAPVPDTLVDTSVRKVVSLQVDVGK